MSLQFISPVFLLGALGLALPVLVHLLTRRQQTHLQFSAVYLLKQSQKRSIRRSRPNRLLLLLFRCLAIVFLSLALAGPLFSLGGSGDLLPAASSANVFILDDSYSMSAKSGETTLHRKAAEFLLALIQKMPDDNQFSLVLASAPPRVIQDWTLDRQTLLKLLKVGRPSPRTTQIGKAVSLAAGRFASSTRAGKRLFILTDRERNGWVRKDFPKPPPKDAAYRVHILDFSKVRTEPNRAAVQNVEVSQEFLSNSRIIRIHTRILNLLPGKRIAQLPVSFWINEKKQGEGTVDLPPNTTEEKEFTFPYLGNEPIRGYVEIGGDGITLDNRRYFFYQPDRKVKVLVVDGDPKTVAHQSETFYLERALNPFATSLSDIDPTVSTLAELPGRSLRRFSVVMLCNVRELPLGFERELENFVLRGGALFITLGDQIDPNFYNEKLGNLLPVTIASLNQVGPADEPFRLDAKPSGHPVLKIFDANTLREMQGIRFNSLYSVETREGRDYTVPMKFTNGFPALVESAFGKGKTFLFVSSIDRDWNNFSIQPTFLPWIQRWVKYSARSLESLTRKKLLVGEPFVWEGEGEAHLVKLPGGMAAPLPANPDTGEVRFEKTHRPGIYELYRSPSLMESQKSPGEGTPIVTELPTDAERLGGFTVNIDTGESNPEKISGEEIKTFFPGLRIEFTSDPLQEKPSLAENSFELTTPFFLLVAFMFFCEAWLVRRE